MKYLYCILLIFFILPKENLLAQTLNDSEYKISKKVKTVSYYFDDCVFSNGICQVYSLINGFNFRINKVISYDANLELQSERKLDLEIAENKYKSLFIFQSQEKLFNILTSSNEEFQSVDLHMQEIDPCTLDTIGDLLIISSFQNKIRAKKKIKFTVSEDKSKLLISHQFDFNHIEYLVFNTENWNLVLHGTTEFKESLILIKDRFVSNDGAVFLLAQNTNVLRDLAPHHTELYSSITKSTVSISFPDLLATEFKFSETPEGTVNLNMLYFQLDMQADKIDSKYFISDISDGMVIITHLENGPSTFKTEFVPFPQNINPNPSEDLSSEQLSNYRFLQIETGENGKTFYSIQQKYLYEFFRPWSETFVSNRIEKNIWVFQLDQDFNLNWHNFIPVYHLRPSSIPAKFTPRLGTNVFILNNTFNVLVNENPFLDSNKKFKEKFYRNTSTKRPKALMVHYQLDLKGNRTKKVLFSGKNGKDALIPDLSSQINDGIILGISTGIYGNNFFQLEYN